MLYLILQENTKDKCALDSVKKNATGTDSVSIVTFVIDFAQKV